jgi:outer membrane protease
MNNITTYAVFVIVLFSAQYAFGQEAVIGIGNEPSQVREGEVVDYALFVHPSSGFIYGQSEEIVYPSNTKGELLSQLLWDMKPVFYHGLRTDFSRTRPLDKWGVFANLSLKLGIPDISGNMEDRDWMSTENTALTHYSIHENSTREMFLFDFSAGFTFPFLRVMLLKAFVNVSFMNFRFSGSDGHGIYAEKISAGKYHPIDDNPRLENFDGKVINYSQKWLTAAPGVSLGYYFFKRFFAELSFQISPLILCAALDDHLTTNTQFRDYLRGGLFIEPGADLSFSFNDWVALSLEFSWKYITGTMGNSFSRTYGRGDYIQSGTTGAGAGLTFLDTGFFLRIRL